MDIRNTFQSCFLSILLVVLLSPFTQMEPTVNSSRSTPVSQSLRAIRRITHAVVKLSFNYVLTNLHTPFRLLWLPLPVDVTPARHVTMLIYCSAVGLITVLSLGTEYQQWLVLSQSYVTGGIISLVKRQIAVFVSLPPCSPQFRSASSTWKA